MKKADEGVGRAMEAMVQVGRGFRKEEGWGSALPAELKNVLDLWVGGDRQSSCVMEAGNCIVKLGRVQALEPDCP